MGYLDSHSEVARTSQASPDLILKSNVNPPTFCYREYSQGIHTVFARFAPVHECEYVICSLLTSPLPARATGTAEREPVSGQWVVCRRARGAVWF